MQSYGPLAASSHELNFAVYPEPKAVPLITWHSIRQQIAKFCFFLIALAIAGATASASEGTLTFSPSSLSVGNVAIETSHSTAVTIKNTGTAPVTITGEAVHAGAFSISGLAVGTTIQVGASATLTIKFSPTSTGLSAGYINIARNPTKNYGQYSVNGTGVSSTRAISLSTTSLNFGNEVVGGTSTLAVAVKNTGNLSLTVSAITITGTGFGLSNGTSGATLAAGQTANLNVVFSPKAAGSASGKITIASNAGNSPSTITVAGTGVSSTGHSVTLNWEPSASANIVGYYVYRMSVLDLSYARLTSFSVTGLKLTDTTVNAFETYYYAVTAVNSSGAQSGYSDQAIAIIP